MGRMLVGRREKDLSFSLTFFFLGGEGQGGRGRGCICHFECHRFAKYFRCFVAKDTKVGDEGSRGGRLKLSWEWCWFCKSYGAWPTSGSGRREAAVRCSTTDTSVSYCAFPVYCIIEEKRKKTTKNNREEIHDHPFIQCVFVCFFQLLLLLLVVVFGSVVLLF